MLFFTESCDQWFVIIFLPSVLLRLNQIPSTHFLRVICNQPSSGPQATIAGQLPAPRPLPPPHHTSVFILYLSCSQSSHITRGPIILTHDPKMIDAHFPPMKA